MEELFRFPIQSTIIGKSMSGKTRLLQNVILPKIMKDYEGIYIFSPTADIDQSWSKFKKSLSKKIKEKFYLIDEFNNEEVLDLIEMIKENKILGSKDKYLIIFDDATDKFKTSKKDMFAILAFRGRHCNISIIFISHKHNAISPIVRNNVRTKIYYRISNNRELKTMLEDNETFDLKGNHFNNMFNSNTGDFNAFCIDSNPNSDDYYQITNKGKLVKLIPENYGNSKNIKLF